MSDFDDAGKSSGPAGIPDGFVQRVLEAIAEDKRTGKELVPGLHDLAFTTAKRSEWLALHDNERSHRR